MSALRSQLGQARPLRLQFVDRLTRQQTGQARKSLVRAGFRLLQQAQEQRRTRDLAQRRQIVEGHAPFGVRHSGATQQVSQHRLDPRELQDFRGAERLEQVLQASRIVLGQRTSVGDGFAPLGLQLAEGLLEGVVQVVIQRFLEDGQCHFGGLGRAEEARTADGLQADARAFVISQLGEERQGIGNAIAPVAKHAPGSGAGIGLG